MGRPKKPADIARTTCVTVRMTAEEVQAIDDMSKRLAARTLGSTPLPRTEILRLAVPRGLAAMAAELEKVG